MVIFFQNCRKYKATTHTFFSNWITFFKNVTTPQKKCYLFPLYSFLIFSKNLKKSIKSCSIIFPNFSGFPPNWRKLCFSKIFFIREILIEKCLKDKATTHTFFLKCINILKRSLSVENFWRIHRDLINMRTINSKWNFPIKLRFVRTVTITHFL